MSTAETYHHRRLDCGIELVALPLDGRMTTAFDIRVLCGMAEEPADRLGVARLVEGTIGKGTESKTAQELTDAFDAIGAQCGSGVGRESMVFRCSCLPEYAERALALHAEMLRTPTFPESFYEVAVDLARQELTALEDDPGELSQKLIGPQAYGPVLGRHELGTAESLDRMTRDDVVSYWRRCFGTGRIRVAIAGLVDLERVTAALERMFAGFNAGQDDDRSGHPAVFSPGVRHHQKELEQEHMLLCWPGLKITDDAYPVQRVAVSILGDGMSSRLFTEVREKLGLVYWVGAWQEFPRHVGMIFMGASAKAERAEQTARAMLKEADRLGEDITEEELNRVKTGIIAKSQTHGDITQARTSELSSDLFHYGRPIPLDEKNARIAAVTVSDVRQYLAEHPRGELCMMTLGPQALDEAKLTGGDAEPRTEKAGGGNSGGGCS